VTFYNLVNKYYIKRLSSKNIYANKIQNFTLTKPSYFFVSGVF